MTKQSRAQLTDNQRRWRQARAPAINVYLDERDLATLDAIAIQLYYEHPHDPNNGLHAPDVLPRRPQAIRELCSAWRKAHHNAPETVLGEFCSALPVFFTREAFSRRAKHRRRQRPKPPWRGGVAILEALGVLYRYRRIRDR